MRRCRGQVARSIVMAASVPAGKARVVGPADDSRILRADDDPRATREYGSRCAGSRPAKEEEPMRRIAAALLAALLCLVAPAVAGARSAPGAPGAKEPWAGADKQGFGTSATLAS